MRRIVCVLIVWVIVIIACDWMVLWIVLQFVRLFLIAVVQFVVVIVIVSVLVNVNVNVIVLSFLKQLNKFTINSYKIP
jgi:hypothetical protein